jgi:hypothetical protein
MAKLTTTDLTNLTNETKATSTINANNALIETALENTLSRDGTSPNTMSADIDLNSNDLLNVGDIEAATGTIAGFDIALGFLSGTPKGAWTVATVYVVGDIVSDTTFTYIANTAHTSDATTFATDNDLGYWTILDSQSDKIATPETFSGDAAEVDFVLSVQPSTENHILVFIDGVKQKHDSFSLGAADKTITFTTAPPTGTDNIEVWYVAGNSTGTTGATGDTGATGAQGPAGSLGNGGSLGGAINELKGADVASAGTCEIWSPEDGNLIHVTGTTGITSLGTAAQAGSERIVVFDDALILTHNGTSLIIPGAANITTATGDIMIVRAETTTNHRIVNYVKASGAGVVTAAVADGGTGAATLTDGGILLGSGTSAITAMGALADGSIVVGDGNTDPVALAAFDSSTGNLLGAKGGTIGQQTIWVPAGAMEARVTTEAATSNAVEIGTSLFAARTMDFATGTDNYAHFHVLMPKGWDETIGLVYQMVWSATGQTGGLDSVVWNIAAVSHASSGVLTTAFPTPTALTLQEHSATNDDVMITAESSAVIPDGSPGSGAEELVLFQVGRDVSADDLDVDARLHGVKIHYTLNTGVDT